MSAALDLRAELAAALKLLEDFQVSTEPAIEDVSDPENDDPEPGDLVKLYLAASHDREVEMTVEQVLSITTDLREGVLVETKMLIGSNWAIIRVVGRNDKAEYFGQTVSYHHVADRFFECDAANIHLHLQGGVNALAFHYSQLGTASEIFPEFG